MGLNPLSTGKSVQTLTIGIVYQSIAVLIPYLQGSLFRLFTNAEMITRLSLNPLSTGKSVQTDLFNKMQMKECLNPLSTGKSVQTFSCLSFNCCMCLNPLSTGKSVQTL